jgi:hypothetical protein
VCFSCTHPHLREGEVDGERAGHDGVGVDKVRRHAVANSKPELGVVVVLVLLGVCVSRVVQVVWFLMGGMMRSVKDERVGLYCLSGEASEAHTR